MDVGVVLVNLGTPDSPEPKAVARYLRSFLSDPRVVEAPRALWWFVLNFLIIPRRARSVSENYRLIWGDSDSPLREISKAQALALQVALNETTNDEGKTNYHVAYGMTYGRPEFAELIESFVHKGINRIFVLPLYPQYSGSTTGAVYDQLADFVKGRRRVPDLRVQNSYFDHPVYIEALAASVEQHFSAQRPPERLLMSFHGVPQAYVDKGDPYYHQCLSTGEALAEALGLQQGQWGYGFQSRFGKAEWVKPYTDDVLLRWAQEGVKDVAVICPAFAADCLETLEEINVQSRELFLRSGGESFSTVPCLNASQLHIDLLKNLVHSAY